MDYYNDYETLTQGLYGGSDYTSSMYNTAAGVGIWGIIALILAIVGGILVYFLFVKSKTEPKGKFAKWLKDFLAFKIMWIEPILKVVYYIATIFVILFSFTFLGTIGVSGGFAILAFFSCLILGPVAVRIAYEMTMMFIMIWRNTRDIAENTKKK
ncbi:hypothetical protein IKG49_01905 [Candidatus Saccharibacteria bacterium]|nr:hypothetical protein [Candidatus Saccharibacteria bacterium]